MTQREYAVDLINTLSDKQVQTLISFITNFCSIDTPNITSQEELAVPEKSKSQSLKRLKEIIRSVPVDDEKEILAKHREEKYGS